MTKELEEVMVDVRRAYRLLAVYQRRLLDLGTSMASMLGFEFGWWEPGTSRPPQSSSDPSTVWVWDLLPAHRATFSYHPREAPKPGGWMFTLQHDPDSGFKQTGRKEPDAASFEPAENARSLIRLHGFAILSGETHDWKAVWNAADYAPSPEAPWRGTVADCQVVAVAREHSVVELYDEASAEAALRSLQGSILQHAPKAKKYLP